MGDGNHGDERRIATDDTTLPDPSLPSTSGPAASADSPLEADADLHSVTDVHPSPRYHAPAPRLIRDSMLWVWLWAIGAIVLIILIIVLLRALPSKKGLPPAHHSVPAATQSASYPVRTIERASGFPKTGSWLRVASSTQIDTVDESPPQP